MDNPNDFEILATNLGLTNFSSDIFEKFKTQLSRDLKNFEDDFENIDFRETLKKKEFVNLEKLSIELKEALLDLGRTHVEKIEDHFKKQIQTAHDSEWLSQNESEMPIFFGIDRIIESLVSLEVACENIVLDKAAFISQGPATKEALTILRNQLCKIFFDYEKRTDLREADEHSPRVFNDEYIFEMAKFVSLALQHFQLENSQVFNWERGPKYWNVHMKEAKIFLQSQNVSFD